MNIELSDKEVRTLLSALNFYAHHCMDVAKELYACTNPRGSGATAYQCGADAFDLQERVRAQFRQEQSEQK